MSNTPINPEDHTPYAGHYAFKPGNPAAPGENFRFPVCNDGGPAFPQPIDDMGTLTALTPGMSLRDYFAAKALPALIASPFAASSTKAEIVGMAYWFADEMLKMREVGK